MEYDVNEIFDIEAPKGLNPCRICHEHCYGAEGVNDDEVGLLISIGSLCSQSWVDNQIDNITEWGTIKEAIAEWNQDNPITYSELIKVINNGNFKE
jgi:hypothetical protein